MQNQNDVAVIKIVGTVHNTLISAFPQVAKSPISQETLLSLAKECGLIFGKRGRGGGFEPTDEGLTFAGLDVVEFRNVERIEAAKRQAENEARKAERQQSLADALNQMRAQNNRLNS